MKRRAAFPALSLALSLVLPCLPTGCGDSTQVPASDSAPSLELDSLPGDTALEPAVDAVVAVDAADIGAVLEVEVDVDVDVASDSDLPSDAPPELPSELPLDVPPDVPGDGETGPEVTVGACPDPPDDLADILAIVEVMGDGRHRTIEGLAWPGLLPRGVRIYLPEAYETSPETHFPVLYMHDGQNLYEDGDAAFGVAWEVDEVLDALTDAGQVQPHIVVGIDNTAERIWDYTPSVDPDYGGGGADLYADLVALRIKPIIDHSFRTLCDRSSTAIAGSSLGGIVSLHIYLRYPEVFGRVAAVSPSLWWDGELMLDTLSSWAGPWPERLWIDMGTGEGSPTSATPGLPASIALLRQTRSHLLGKGMILGEDLGYLEDFGAVHDEASWEGRLPSILRAALGPSSPGTLPLEAVGLFILADTLHPVLDPVTHVLVETSRDGVRMTVPSSEAALTALDPSVATIDADGLIQALGTGIAGFEAELAEVGSTFKGVDSVVVGGAGFATIELIATVPAWTPAGDTIYVVGDLPQLGAWNPGLVAMEPLPDGTWIHAFSLPMDSSFEIKLTRGNWATVEKAADGSEIPNHVFDVTGGDTLSLISLIVEAWADD